MLHSVYDLKATQINVYRSLNRELIFYKFELGYKRAKTFIVRKAKVQLIILLKHLVQKFCWSSKNIIVEVKWWRLQIVDSEVVP